MKVKFKWFHEKQGSGFTASEVDDKVHFMSINDVEGRQIPFRGQMREFELTSNAKGLKVTCVRLLMLLGCFVLLSGLSLSSGCAGLSASSQMSAAIDQTAAFAQPYLQKARKSELSIEECREFLTIAGYAFDLYQRSYTTDLFEHWFDSQKTIYLSDPTYPRAIDAMALKATERSKCAAGPWATTQTIKGIPAVVYLNAEVVKGAMDLIAVSAMKDNTASRVKHVYGRECLSVRPGRCGAGNG